MVNLGLGVEESPGHETMVSQGRGTRADLNNEALAGLDRGEMAGLGSGIVGHFAVMDLD